MTRDESTGGSPQLANLGAILLGVAGVTGLALLGTGNFDGYAQALWGVAMIVGVVVLVYAE